MQKYFELTDGDLDSALLTLALCISFAKGLKGANLVVIFPQSKSFQGGQLLNLKIDTYGIRSGGHKRERGSDILRSSVKFGSAKPYVKSQLYSGI